MSIETLGRHRPLWPQQAGLAPELSGSGEPHSPHGTGQCVLMLIDPDACEARFTAWVGSLVAGFKREMFRIDGKTVQRSFDQGRERSPLHVVSTWASEQGLVLWWSTSTSSAFALAHPTVPIAMPSTTRMAQGLRTRNFELNRAVRR